MCRSKGSRRIFHRGEQCHKRLVRTPIFLFGWRISWLPGQAKVLFGRALAPEPLRLLCVSFRCRWLGSSDSLIPRSDVAESGQFGTPGAVSISHKATSLRREEPIGYSAGRGHGSGKATSHSAKEPLRSPALADAARWCGPRDKKEAIETPEEQMGRTVRWSGEVYLRGCERQLRGKVEHPSTWKTRGGCRGNHL